MGHYHHRYCQIVVLFDNKEVGFAHYCDVDDEQPHSTGDLHYLVLNNDFIKSNFDNEFCSSTQQKPFAVIVAQDGDEQLHCKNVWVTSHKDMFISETSNMTIIKEVKFDADYPCEC